MRRVLLVMALAAMLMVPVGTATLLATSPDKIHVLPIGVWAAWLIVSLIVTLEAPALGDWLTPPRHGVYGAIRYARGVLVLGLTNLASSAAALLYLAISHPVS